MSTPTPDETLLGLLALEPQHGYQLLEHFRDHQRLGAVWDMSTSQIYAVLNRLERLGYIVGRQVEVENAPIRTCYALTASGQNALNNWLRQAGPSFDTSLALEFMGFAGPDVREGVASLRDKRSPKFGG